MVIGTIRKFLDYFPSCLQHKADATGERKMHDEHEKHHKIVAIEARIACQARRSDIVLAFVATWVFWLSPC